MRRRPELFEMFSRSLCEMRIPENAPCIYFLCDDLEIVYVGVTGDPRYCISRHLLGTKEFDRVFTLPVHFSDETTMNDLGWALIAIIRPKYNKTGRSANLNFRHLEILKKYRLENLMKEHNEALWEAGRG